MKPAILGIAFVLAGSADWGLVSPDPNGATVICAKDRASCEAAQAAVRRGWLRDWPADAVCQPLPDCFTPESKCIENFNCK